MNLSPHRGQLNFEYLALTGILLAVLLPFIYTSLSTVQEQYKSTRVEDIVSQVVSKANDLYKLGPGNKDNIHIIMPAGITGATIVGNSIALEATMGKKNTTVLKYTESDVIGSLDTIQGEYMVAVKALNESLVRIGSGPWIVSLDPSCIGAPNFANPPNITIHGDDFSSSSVLLMDGVPFNPSFYQVVDPGTVIFIAGPTQFWAQPGGTPYVITVQDGSKTSNADTFYVYPSPQQCP